MNEAKVTKEDLLYAAAQKYTVVRLSEVLGVSRSAVARACLRHGVELQEYNKLTPLEKLYLVNEDLTPMEALENAYFVISEMSGQDDGSCHWPDRHITSQRRAIAQLLYKNEGKVVSNEMMLNALYMHDQDRANPNSMKVQISHLRKNLEGTGFDIETVWGRGYRFNRLHGTVFPWEEKDTQ